MLTVGLIGATNFVDIIFVLIFDEETKEIEAEDRSINDIRIIIENFVFIFIVISVIVFV